MTSKGAVPDERGSCCTADRAGPEERQEPMGPGGTGRQCQQTRTHQAWKHTSIGKGALADPEGDPSVRLHNSIGKRAE